MFIFCVVVVATNCTSRLKSERSDEKRLAILRSHANMQRRGRIVIRSAFLSMSILAYLQLHLASSLPFSAATSEHYIRTNWAHVRFAAKHPSQVFATQINPYFVHAHRKSHSAIPAPRSLRLVRPPAPLPHSTTLQSNLERTHP